MDSVLMIISAIIIVICPRKGVFIHRFKLKASLKEGIEVDISAKEKNDPPSQSDRSNHKH